MISMSTLADNFFILHVPTEYDYVVESKKKSEVVTVLCEVIKELTGNRPQITFSDKYGIFCECSKPDLAFSTNWRLERCGRFSSKKMKR